MRLPPPCQQGSPATPRRHFARWACRPVRVYRTRQGRQSRVARLACPAVDTFCGKNTAGQASRATRAKQVLAPTRLFTRGFRAPRGCKAPSLRLIRGETPRRRPL